MSNVIHLCILHMISMGVLGVVIETRFLLWPPFSPTAHANDPLNGFCPLWDTVGHGTFDTKPQTKLVITIMSGVI